MSTVVSELPEASDLPSGAKAMLQIVEVAFREWISLPVAGSHRRIVWSELAEARVLLSGDQQTDITESPCPVKERTCLPVVGSQSRMVLSALAEANILPSGDQEME